MNEFFVVIPACGGSTRFSGNTPKQFCCIDSEVVIRKVVRLFLSFSEIAGIICVVSEESIQIYNEIFQSIKDSRLLDPVFGGDSRQKSVMNGLEAINKFNPKYVLIHDAARQNVSEDIVSRVMISLKNGSKAVIPAIKPVDSIRFFNKAVDRNAINLVQTPQGFDYNLIYNLHKKYTTSEVSDDASLCDLEGVDVDIVEGNKANNKITFQDDIVSSNIKVGFGFDAHAFSDNPSRKLYLLGVLIEGNVGLEGVSDADVGIHSLVDAIIGALGLGSIGEHFPPTYIEWKDCDSKLFLEYCAKLLKQHKYFLVNADITIVCEEPKILNHSNEMRGAISNILGVDKSFINIKGKTTEGLGYTGRKEGIAAYSSILIQKKNN